MVVATLVFLPTGPIGWVLVALAWWWYLSLLKRGVPAAPESRCVTEDSEEPCGASYQHGDARKELSTEDREVLEKAGVRVDED